MVKALGTARSKVNNVAEKVLALRTRAKRLAAGQALRDMALAHDLSRCLDQFRGAAGSVFLLLSWSALPLIPADQSIEPRSNSGGASKVIA